MKRNEDILIVDDEADIRMMVGDILEDEGYQTRSVGTVHEAFSALEEKLPNLLILDIWLQGSQMDGLEFLSKFKESYPHIPVLMISGHGNIETAVQSIKRGAYDFIEKPFKADKMLILVERALQATRLTRENQEYKRGSDQENQAVLIGSSSLNNTLRQRIEKLAQGDESIMIIGPTGAGKKSTGRLIHEASKRADGPFVTLNCSAISSSNQIDELMGAELQNASPKIGALERAHGGTLVITDVDYMPKDLQAKFVRVLQEKSFQRLGSRRNIELNVRIIVTCSADLAEEVEEGSFRQDLYYALSRTKLVLPALTNRQEDIPTLIDFFVNDIVRTTSLKKRKVDTEALVLMQNYDWPGNLRQLRNLMEWMLIIKNHAPMGEMILGEDLPKALSNALPESLQSQENSQILTLPLKQAREIFERDYLMSQVNRFGGNISKTANFVGMDRTALHRKLKTLGLHTSKKKEAV